jgi:small subunit ribosomal protein S3Ae
MLKIVRVEGDKAFTEIVSQEVSRPFLMRMIRRRISKIDYVESFTLADGKKVKLKILVITAYKANAGQKTAVYRKLKEELAKAVPAMDFNSLIVSISTNKFQKEIAKNLKIVYPIRFLEVRKLEVLKEKKKE